MEHEEVFLTKAKLLAGKQETMDVETEMGTFRIRSLTEGEKIKAESLLFRGLKASGGLLNMQSLKIEGQADQIYLNETELDFYIIMCALNLEDPKADKYSINDVKNIPFKGTTKQVLVQTIRAMSNMFDAAARAQEFFQNSAGTKSGADDNAG